MSVILCIETASTNCSISLGVDGKILCVKEDYNNSFSHAEMLHLYIRDILKENNVLFSELDAIAVSKGPGSYTGLRIGVSTAKGLCFSLDVPLISVPTLTSLAYQAEGNGFIVPMLDARRMEVYTAVFNEHKEQVSPTKAQILDENSYVEFLEKDKVNFLGSGVEKFSEICSHPNAVFIQGKLPSAREMVALAASKYKISDFENVAYFEPYYLKDFIAG